MEAKLFVVLKFVYGRRGSGDPIVSKTMGRYAVISHRYSGAMPQPETFWVCEMEKEWNRQDDTKRGCFIVTPLYPIPVDAISKLIPGTYTQEINGSQVLLKPKLANHYWIAPYALKSVFLKDAEKYQSVVVPVDPPKQSHEVLKAEALPGVQPPAVV